MSTVEETAVAATTEVMSELDIQEPKKETTILEEDSNVTVVNRIVKLSEISVDMIHSSDDDTKTNMICLQGWIYSVRVQGAGGTLIFLDINDGSIVTPIRCLAEYHPPSSTSGTEEGIVEGSSATDASSSTPSMYLYNNDTPNSAAKYSYVDPTGESTQTTLIPIDTSEYQPLSFEQMSSSTNCCIGCSCMVFGYVTKPPTATATQPYEIKIQSLYMIGTVPDASKYPIQKSILKKPIALRSYYHSRFRAPIIQQFMIIRSTTLYTIHEFFHQEKVPLLDPNIMTNNDCEGAGEVFTVMNSDTFFHTTTVATNTIASKGGKAPPTVNIIHSQNKEATTDDSVPAADTTATVTTTEPATITTVIENATATTTNVDQDTLKCDAASNSNYIGLTVSSQLPLEAIAMGTGSVYTCQKSFRAEKSDTNKHLAEFLHIEYESYFITLYDLMNQVERFVKYVIRNVLERCQEQYAFLNNRTTGPEEFHQHNTYLSSLLDKPFVRIKHADAVTVLLDDARNKVMTYNPVTKQNVKLKFKVKPAYGEDLGSEHEKYLVQKFGTFVFVTHWPSDIKSFYMKQVGDETCESFDLLAPIVGELFGGSMREWRYDVLESIMNKKQMDVSTLQWFINLRKDGGTAPHGGWGMGFDRLVMFLTNTQSVRDIVPYPVYYGHCPY